MRIAFFLTYFPKLSEVFLLNQALALLDRGHDVRLYALANPREARMQPGSERFLERDRSRIGRMPPGSWSRVLALPAMLFRNRPREVLRSLDAFRYGSEAASLRNLFRLDSVRDDPLECDIAHAQFGNVARQVVFLKDLGRLAAPLVTSFRGNDLSRYLASARPGVYDAVFRASSLCLPVAARWVETLEELGCPREKIRPFPSGIPMDRVPLSQDRVWGSLVPRGAEASAPRPDHRRGGGVASGRTEAAFRASAGRLPGGVARFPGFHLPRDPGASSRPLSFRAEGTGAVSKGSLRIFSAARLEPYKGLHFGLEAFRMLLDDVPNATYEIFGEGPECRRLEEKARKLGVARRVRWHGAVLHSRLLASLPRFHVHWFTTTTLSHGRTEGVPNILKETQAAGIPAVAFHHPGVDEVMVHERTGILVAEGDAGALARETLRLLQDPEKSRVMSIEAGANARRKFDICSLTKTLETWYREILQEGPSR